MFNLCSISVYLCSTYPCMCGVPLATTSPMQNESGSMGNKVSVVKLPKSGGVSQRQSQARQVARNERIFEYFHGPDKTLHPVMVTMEPEKLRVFRLGERRRRWSSIASHDEDYMYVKGMLVRHSWRQ